MKGKHKIYLAYMERTDTKFVVTIRGKGRVALLAF